MKEVEKNIITLSDHWKQFRDGFIKKNPDTKLNEDQLKEVKYAFYWGVHTCWQIVTMLIPKKISKANHLEAMKFVDTQLKEHIKEVIVEHVEKLGGMTEELLKPSDKTPTHKGIEEMYKEYLHLMKLDENTMHPTQATETRRTFYGACGQMIAMLSDLLTNTNPDDDDIDDLLLNMNNQIITFFQSQK